MALLVMLLLAVAIIVGAKAGYSIDFSAIPGIAIQEKVVNANIRPIPIGDKTTIPVLQFSPQVAGEYVLLLNLKLSYVGGSPPFFSCRIDVDETRNASVQDNSFSCSLQLFAALKKGETVTISAGQAAGSDRPVSGSLIALRTNP